MKMESAAADRPITSQNASGCWEGMGSRTFIENIETTSVGTMMPMVMMFSVFTNTLMLFETMEARASIMLARMFE